MLLILISNWHMAAGLFSNPTSFLWLTHCNFILEEKEGQRVRSSFAFQDIFSFSFSLARVHTDMWVAMGRAHGQREWVTEARYQVPLSGRVPLFVHEIRAKSTTGVCIRCTALVANMKLPVSDVGASVLTCYLMVKYNPIENVSR